MVGPAGRLMKAPRLRVAAAVADVEISCGAGTAAETFPADLRRLSIDVIPNPDAVLPLLPLPLLLLIIKPVGRRLGLCGIGEGEGWGEMSGTGM